MPWKVAQLIAPGALAAARVRVRRRRQGLKQLAGLVRRVPLPLPPRRLLSSHLQWRRRRQPQLLPVLRRRSPRQAAPLRLSLSHRRRKCPP